MPTDLSRYLSEIPKRTQRWVHQHIVQDYRGADGKMHPTPVNRRERRAVGKWFGPNTSSYVKPITEENN